MLILQMSQRSTCFLCFADSRWERDCSHELLRHAQYLYANTGRKTIYDQLRLTDLGFWEGDRAGLQLIKGLFGLLRKVSASLNNCFTVTTTYSKSIKFEAAFEAVRFLLENDYGTQETFLVLSIVLLFLPNLTAIP